ncbi:MAG: tetratricopeptide repeat protein, partial [Calditrichaeota bacterium]|nr:tetratricopeptide repeat protein [Calditrichota bacterium]
YDLLDYLAANMGLVKNNLYQAMQLSHQVSFSIDESRKIGMGWYRDVTATNDIIWHDNVSSCFSSYIGFTADNKRGVVILSNSENPVNDIGKHLLDLQSKLADMKPSIGLILNQLIRAGNINAISSAYKSKRQNEISNYNFAEAELEKLGRLLLLNNQLTVAIEIFKLNAGSYPKSSQVYSSLGDALFKNKQIKEAILFFQKSVEQNPDNLHARNMIKKLTGK